MDTKDRLIEERKRKVISFLKKPCVWVVGLLIIAVILGVYIRSLPMQDHGNGVPGLWDVTTNDWTLGPDLDPWLFTRYAKTIVENGSLPEVDTMRNVPLGFETAKETKLLPYMIAGTYYFVNVFGDYSVEFAAAFFPVIMFVLTILAFFLFVREIFIGEDKKSKIKANIISIISTFFMIVIPIFLSRTIAGIPEKESAGFFFMFLAFYLFLRGWRSKTVKGGAVWAILAGISTALMGLISGLVVYVFVAIGVASFLAFILNQIHKKEFVIYFLWIISTILIILLFTKKFSLVGFITGIDTGLAVFTLFLIGIHNLIWNTSLFKKFGFIKNTQLPKSLVSLIIGVSLVVVILLTFLGLDFILDKLRLINQILFKPVTGRWNITVAENRQPYFTEWGASFGPFIKNIPVFFWLFFVGSIVLFKKMLGQIKKRHAWILTGLYILFFLGLVFSRYSSSGIFNGENFLSKFFYYFSALLFFGALIYYYTKRHGENRGGFESIDYNLLFLFSFLILGLFTARSAVRLIMVLAPIASIPAGFLIVEGFERLFGTRDKTGKTILMVLMIILVIVSLFVFWNYYQEIKSQSYAMVPSAYNQQWQKAMYWVRENTTEPIITENTYSGPVFAHWWDYGYWVQSIGERATVLDGGNAISFWNYYMGRLVLTGDNQKDALEFLYNHNATHLLIDSTDIGKYGAYSSIGSAETLDRYSWIPIMVSDASQTKETSEGMIVVYSGGMAIDEDIYYSQGNGTEIFLPLQKSWILGVVLEYSLKEGNYSFNQPVVVVYYNDIRYSLPLRYLDSSNGFVDFGEGLEGGIKIIPKIDVTSQGGVEIDNMGSIIYLSPRVLKGYVAQKYLLKDPFNNFNSFKLVHQEPNLLLDNLQAQGANIGEFAYFQGLQGPIKIWEIEYAGNEKLREEYLDTDASKYLSWQL